METKKGILNYMADRDTFCYSQFLKYHSAKDEFHNYQYLAVVDDFSVYDGMQIKTDTDGEIKQHFIELKGRYVDITAFSDCAIDAFKIRQLQRLSYCSNIPTYIIGIYYKDSKLAIWKIDDEKEYKTELMECWESQIDLSKNGKVTKEMVKLPLSEATICKIPQEITNQALNDF